MEGNGAEVRRFEEEVFGGVGLETAAILTGSAPHGVGPVGYDGTMTQDRPMNWRLKRADDARVLSLSGELGVSEITARVLVSRGLSDAASARSFLSPSLARDWAEPTAIPGMSHAAERVARSISSGERIVVFGDFDLDGVSAAAVATRGLAALGATVSAIVPHRFREGYGLSEAAVLRVLESKPSLVITVDCGISAAREVALLAERGVDVVVTDHHEPGDSVPAGVPVANPKLDRACPSFNLAGAGVALKLVQAVGAALGEPDLWMDFTDLASLGTVADVVSLTGENRALVAHGLERARTRPSVPIAALCGVAGVSIPTLTSENIAYTLSPRLNAAGRVADPVTSLDLLLTDDPLEAERLACVLDEYNRQRQGLEADLEAAAVALAERTYDGERALLLAGEGWHEGIKGIVASRLAGVYAVPTLLFSIHDGVARGSGRSVGSVDLFRSVEQCAQLLDRFGGHSAAVGLTLPASRLEEFRAALLAVMDALPQEQFVVETEVDAEVELEQLSVELGAELSLLEPFGEDNRRPRLATRAIYMNDRKRVGKMENHLKFTAYDGVSAVPAIAFRCRDIEVLAVNEAPADVVFELEVDEWRGRKRAQMKAQRVFPRLPDDEQSGETFALIEEMFAHADEIIVREEYAGIGDAGSFHTKLAGVTFEGRQDVLGRLAPGSPLRLVRQPDNEFDANAVAVLDPHGDQVGFLNRRLAGVLASVIDAGVEYDVEVSEVTGGGESRSLGVNVLVVRRDLRDDTEDRAAQMALRRAELAALAPEELDAELVRRFIGDRSLHAAQAQALAALARRRSTLAVMATGRGKSLIFHLHAARIALREGHASVFVYPLRALVADQAFHLSESFAEVGLSVRVVTGETSQRERDEAFLAASAGELDVVLTTPEFLHFHGHRFAEAGRFAFLVVDEAHHVGLSRAGNRPAYARLGEAIERLGNPTVLAVTATASDDVAAQIQSTLGIEEVVLDPTVRENLAVADERGRSDKDAYLLSLAARGDKMIVYVNSRDASVRIARLLRQRLPQLAWKIAFYNGGLTRLVRHKVEKAFRGEELAVVVATSAFGEGVNIPDVRHVVLYHLPFNEVEFNQMAGRAGRDGAASQIHLLFGEKDARINEKILSSLAPSRDDLAALYTVLRDLQAAEADGFEITNAELAERCGRVRRGCALDDRSVSTALGVFRELGFVTGEGHGAYRRLTFIPGSGPVELAASVRYAEGLDEIEQFGGFKEWVSTASADDLLTRFNRPILPSAT